MTTATPLVGLTLWRLDGYFLPMGDGGRQAWLLGRWVAIALMGAGAAPAVAESSPAGRARGDVVAVVIGTPITKQTVDHWIRVAARSEAPFPPAPAFAPTNPPGFKGCIHQARERLEGMEHATYRRLKRFCTGVFKELSSQVMDFLITARWYQALAAAKRIHVTEAQVVHAFRKARRAQFPTRRAFRRFLAETGQTVGDILFRFRIILISERLISPASGSPAAVDSEARRRYRPLTECARYYVVKLCADSPQPPRRSHTRNHPTKGGSL